MTRPWSMTTCEVCQGTGELPIEVEDRDEPLMFVCWYCTGTGEYEAAT